MCYTIKSKQEQIEYLESANTSLQIYCIELETANEELVEAIMTARENAINNKYEEILRLQTIIDTIKDDNKEIWFILYKT